MYSQFIKAQSVLLLKKLIILLLILVSIPQEDRSGWKFSTHPHHIWVMSIALCQILGRFGDFK